jgi:hypothetical protein
MLYPRKINFYEIVRERWLGVVPEIVARAQADYELCRAIARAVEAGAKHREIADKLGITKAYSHLLYKRGCIMPLVSPVERHLKMPLSR